MSLLGNLIWLLFGGFVAALGYLFGGIVLCITVVGIPWGLQCFKLAGLVLWPFGKEVVSSSNNTGCPQPRFVAHETKIKTSKHSCAPNAGKEKQREVLLDKRGY